MPNNFNEIPVDQELKELKEELAQHRKFKKLATKKRDEALLNGDKESYELWDGEYFDECSEIRRINERIKELEGAR